MPTFHGAEPESLDAIGGRWAIEYWIINIWLWEMDIKITALTRWKFSSKGQVWVKHKAYTLLLNARIVQNFQIP